MFVSLCCINYTYKIFLYVVSIYISCIQVLHINIIYQGLNKKENIYFTLRKREIYDVK
jgi:hypothetical protein